MLQKIRSGLKFALNSIKAVRWETVVFAAVALGVFVGQTTLLISDGTMNDNFGPVFNVLLTLLLSVLISAPVTLCVALAVADACRNRSHTTVQESREQADECSIMIGRIRMLVGTARTGAAPAIQEQLDGIADKCFRIHRVIVADGKQKVAGQFLEQYLKPTESWLAVYERLKSRDISSAQSAIQHSEEIMLPLLAGKLDVFYNQLHVGDIAMLATADVEIELAQKAEIGLEAEALA